MALRWWYPAWTFVITEMMERYRRYIVEIVHQPFIPGQVKPQFAFYGFDRGCIAALAKGHLRRVNRQDIKQEKDKNYYPHYHQQATQDAFYYEFE